MRVIEGLGALEARDLGGAGKEHPEPRSAVCVGVFDGVHLGHLRLVHELLELASELEALPTIVTFRQHPDRLLRGSAPPLLVSVPHRLRLLRRAGVQRLVLLDFDADLREMSARAFAERVLLRGLAARGLLLGYDSALGREREGTPAFFAELGEQLGFVLRTAEPLMLDGETVSSTRIRRAIGEGDLVLAHRLLGRWPSAFGEVVAGEGRGQGLGFPTANIRALDSVLPPPGVYAVLVLHDGELYPAVCNLGVRPTFPDRSSSDGAGCPDTILEVHLLDFQADLYGSILEVSFHERLRAERRFPGPTELQRQIEADIQQARAILAP